MLDDRKAQAGSTAAPAAAWIDSVKPLRHPRQVLGRDAFALVDDFQHQALCVERAQRDHNLAVLTAIFVGIIKQVVDDLQQLRAVAQNLECPRIRGKRDILATLAIGVA